MNKHLQLKQELAVGEGVRNLSCESEAGQVERDKHLDSAKLGRDRTGNGRVARKPEHGERPQCPNGRWYVSSKMIRPQIQNPEAAAILHDGLWHRPREPVPGRVQVGELGAAGGNAGDLAVEGVGGDVEVGDVDHGEKREGRGSGESVGPYVEEVDAAAGGGEACNLAGERVAADGDVAHLGRRADLGREGAGEAVVGEVEAREAVAVGNAGRDGPGEAVVREGDVAEAEAGVEERGGDLAGEGIVGEVEEAEPGERAEEARDLAGERVAAEVELAERGREGGVGGGDAAGEAVPEEGDGLERGEAGEGGGERAREARAVDAQARDGAGGGVAGDAGEVDAGVPRGRPGRERAARVGRDGGLEVEEDPALGVRGRVHSPPMQQEEQRRRQKKRRPGGAAAAAAPHRGASATARSSITNLQVPGRASRWRWVVCVMARAGTVPHHTKLALLTHTSLAPGHAGQLPPPPRPR